MAGNPSCAFSPSPPHDRCDREPEGRRRQDHDRHQPGGGPVAARQADAAHRSRSAGQQLDVVSRRDDRHAQRLRRHLGAERAGSPTSSCRRRSRTCSSRRRALRWPSSKPSWWGSSTRISGSRIGSTPIREQYPNIVIDCPPTLGLLTVNALVAATHLLIPIQSSYFALEGTDDLLETIEKVRARANPVAAHPRAS